jgi:predicted phosphodiesterase
MCKGKGYMKKNIGLWILACGVIFAACERLDMVGMFAGSSPTIDERWEESMAYNQEAGFDTLYAVAEDYHLYVCTDTHITTKRNRWEHFIASYRADKLCPVAVHLGDIIDARTDVAYVEEALAPQMEGANKHDTLMAVCGNHDIYFQLWEKFLRVFKTSTYYFVVQTPAGKQDLFIVYDSADGTVGSKQLQWLENTLKWADTQNFRHVVACTHTHFFKRDGSQGHTSNYTIEETYALLNLFTQHNVKMVWSGHDHSREITQVKGMTCIVVDSMTEHDEHPYYMLVTMGDQIDYEFIPVP